MDERRLDVDRRGDAAGADRGVALREHDLLGRVEDPVPLLPRSPLVGRRASAIGPACSTGPARGSGRKVERSFQDQTYNVRAMSEHSPSPSVVLRPLRRRHQRRPVPDVRPPPRGGAALLQRAVRLLRAVPLRRRRAGAASTGRRSSSTRSDILEIIKADIEMPPGVILFEDPPMHTSHRELLSRVFTPKRMAALEDQVREFCAGCLDPLVGSDGFDFIADLGADAPDAGHRHAARHPRAGPGRGPRPDRRQPPHRARRADDGQAGGRSPAGRCSPSTSTGGPSTRPTTS